MRKIKFRGKSNGEWYYGDLIHAKEKDDNIHYYIITDEYTTTDNGIELNTCASPELSKYTVGQYTGLKDKNGNEIYETDILEIDEEGRLLFATSPKLYEKYQVVIEHDGCHMVTPLSHYKELNKTEHDFIKLAYLWIVRKYASVVGNITDNLDIKHEIEDIQMPNIETLSKQLEEKEQQLDEYVSDLKNDIFSDEAEKLRKEIYDSIKEVEDNKDIGFFETEENLKSYNAVKHLVQEYKQDKNIIDRMIDYIMIHQQVKTMRRIFCKYCELQNGCTYSGIHRNCIRRYFEHVTKQESINEMHNDLQELLEGDE